MIIIENNNRILFKEFPFPISANAAFRIIMRGRFASHCKSKKYSEYDEIVKAYHFANLKMIKEAQKIIAGWFLENEKTVLNVDLLFYDSLCFNKGDGKVKKSDIFNRIKVAHDKISEIILVDDRYFFSGNLIRIPSDKHHLDIAISKSRVL